MTIKKITSRQNKEIQLIHALQSTKGRNEQGRFIAQGKRVCKTILEHHKNTSLVQLYILKSSFLAAQTLLSCHPTSLDSSVYITLVNDAVMDKISTVQTAPGIVGVFTQPKILPLSQLSFGLILARVRDPGNVGTLIRSATAFGARSIVLIESADPWNQKVVQASAGTITFLPLFILRWQQLIDNKKNLSLCALVPSNGKHPNNISLRNTLLVVGGETTGIPDEWLKHCDMQLTLPMTGNIESLNAAVAGSIALYLSQA